MAQRGRPRKTPVTDEERKQTNRAKYATKHNLPVVTAPADHNELVSAMTDMPEGVELSDSRKERSAVIHDVVKWVKLTPVHTDEECAERIMCFFEAAEKTGEIPTLEKMCLALGVTYQSFYMWENGSLGATRAEICKKARGIIQAIDSELVQQGRIPVVSYIFRAKNFYGMKDQVEQVITNRQAEDEDVDPDEMMKRYNIQ